MCLVGIVAVPIIATRAIAYGRTISWYVRTFGVYPQMIPFILRRMPRYRLAYFSAGLVLGLAFTISGTILLLCDITGSTHYTFRRLWAGGRVSDGILGVTLYIIGLSVIFVTHYFAVTRWRRLQSGE